MKSSLKKFVGLGLIMALSFAISVPAFAVDHSINIKQKNFSNINSEEFSNNKYTYEKQINAMSDQQFDEFVASQISKSNDDKKLEKNLSALGIQVQNIKRSKQSSKKIKNSSLVKNSALDPPTLTYDNGEITMTEAKRGGQPYYRLIANLHPDSNELYPGSLDSVIMYFDSSKASYYSYGYSSLVSLRSGQYATKGTTVFNLNDRNIVGGDDYYCSTYVTPKGSGLDIDFGADWVHTYTYQSTSTTYATSLSFGGDSGISGSIGCSINVTNAETYWQRGDTDAFWSED